MRNKYNINTVDGVDYFSTRDLAATWSDENGGGYITEVFNKDKGDWEETGGIDHHIRDVIAWAKRYHGWRKAARLKKAALISYNWNIDSHHDSDIS